MKVIKQSSSFLFFLFVILLISGFKQDHLLKFDLNSSISKNYNLSKNKKIIQEDLSLDKKKANYSDSLFLQHLNSKISFFKKCKVYDSAIFYTKTAIRQNLKYKDTASLGDLFYKLGLFYRRSNQPIEAFKAYNNAKKYFILINDKSNIGRSTLNQSIIQKNLSDYLGSEETAIIALKYLKPIVDKKYIASAYNILAINSKNQNNFTEAIYWYKKAVNETENPSDIIIYKSNLALSYLSLNEYTKAIDLLSKLSEIYQEKNKKKNPKINDNLIYAKWLENNDFNPTNGLKENLAVHLEENDIYSSIDTYILLAKYNLDKNIDKTTMYAIKALEFSKKIKSIEGELKALRLLIDLKAKKHYYSYVEDYLSINDSINNALLKTKNKFAKIKYDTEKTRDVNLVLNAKIAGDSLRIAKETYNRNLGILVSSILVLSVVFITLNWRQRIKIASYNATAETENRISKKVHDEMANDISTIKTLVKNYIPTNIPIKKQLIEMLDNSYLSARDIASETGEIIFSESFSDDLKNLLMQHNNDNIQIITNLSALNILKLDKQKKVAIYRVLQELMVNMNKHSNATRVIIAYKKENKYNEIRYTDNGAGADLVAKNNGLKNATSRMEDIEGRFSFKTSKDNGFKALLRFKT